MTTYCYGEGTDVGQQLDHNEDNYLSRPDLGLWVVTDGMGGHAAGEVASVMATQLISDKVSRGVDLANAVSQAHIEIQREACENPNRRGMGCTVVALLVKGHQYQIAWVGDSRAYLWDGGNLRQLTRDHSFIQQLIDGGHLSEQEARVHPQRNVITQALGSGDINEIQVDLVTGILHQSEKIILCSDGLNGEIADRVIADILRSRQNEQEAVDALITAANTQGGGNDNITVVIVSAPPNATEQKNKGDTRPLDTREINHPLQAKQRRVFTPLTFALFLAFTVLVIAGSYLLLRTPEPTTQSPEVGRPQLPTRQGISPAPPVDPATVPSDSAITDPEQGASDQSSDIDASPLTNDPKLQQETFHSPKQLRDHHSEFGPHDRHCDFTASNCYIWSRIMFCPNGNCL